METQDQDNFMLTLITDVSRAIARRDELDEQSARRDVVRTSFAAIEGLVWVFREEVIDAANSTYGLEPGEEAVLSETTYSIDRSGTVFSQQRFIPLLPCIRLIAGIAERLSGQRTFDFSTAGWQQLRDAAAIRNRITHPKSKDDLILSAHDVTTNVEALYWLLGNLSDAIGGLVSARAKYLGEFKTVLALLRADDPQTTALYNALRHGPDLD